MAEDRCKDESLTGRSAPPRSTPTPWKNLPAPPRTRLFVPLDRDDREHGDVSDCLWSFGGAGGACRYWARVCFDGLLLNGERVSIEPMASRIPGADMQVLCQFVGQSSLEVNAAERQLVQNVVDLLSPGETLKFHLASRLFN